MRRIIGATLAVAACSVGLAAAAQASPGGKVGICHGTASDTNPYVLIHVSENTLTGGHPVDGTKPGNGDRRRPDYLLQIGSSDCSGLPGDDDGGGDGEF
jgi:hypothetical protein